MKKLFYIFLISSILTCCKKTDKVLLENKSKLVNTTMDENPDLDFFNLKGKIKKFGEIKVLLSIDPNSTFDKLKTDFEVNFMEYHFLQNGNIDYIENINPSPYMLSSRVNFKRVNDSLLINLRSKNEIYTLSYIKKKNVLIVETYNKLDDNTFDYHSEKFIRKSYLKNKGTYVWMSQNEGKTKNFISNNWNYKSILDNNGNEKLIYLEANNKSSILLYKIKYLKYDKNGNWLTRQFLHQSQLYNEFSDFSEYRKIEYYQ